MAVYSLQYGGRSGTFYVIKDADELGGEIVHASCSMMNCLKWLRDIKSGKLHLWKARVLIPNTDTIAVVELPGERTYDDALATFKLIEKSGFKVIEIVRADK